MRGIVILIGALALLAAAAPSRAQDVIAGAIPADQPGPVISRNIQGQFAEHLGLGIYDGIWVGEGSAIPNTRRIRNDVVAGPKAVKTPGSGLV